MRWCSATRDPRRDNGSRSVRGRQSADPRITGGLVSHKQAKRARASRIGIWDTPTGSKRAANRVAWSACRGPSGTWRPCKRVHPAAASIGRLPTRQVVSSGAKMQVQPAALPLNLGRHADQSAGSPVDCDGGQLDPRWSGYCSLVAATKPVGFIAVWRPGGIGHPPPARPSRGEEVLMP
jgi:hypothetical protein